jgi:DNA-binding Xre family transcriptional regulator
MPNPKPKPRPRSTRLDHASDLSARLREEVRARGLSSYAVAQAAGLDPAIVQRFMTGARSDLRLSTASRICAALSLRLVAAGTTTRSRRAPQPLPSPEP